MWKVEEWVFPQFPEVRFLPFLVIFWVLEVGHFCPNMPLGVVKDGKMYMYIKNEHVHVTFVTLIFRNFPWNDDVKSFICTVGMSWMSWGRVEWYWHLRMSYLTSLDHQVLKKYSICWVFRALSVQLFLHEFCNSTNSSAWLYCVCLPDPIELV